MGNLIRNAIGVLLIPLTAAFAYETFQFLAANLGSLVTNWFVYGVFAYAAVHLIAGSRIHFIRVLEHELGHMVVAFAFFKDVKALTVVTVLLNAVFFAIILSVVLDNYPHILTYLESSIARTRETYPFVIEDLRRRAFLPD